MGLNGTLLILMGIGIVLRTFWNGLGFKGFGTFPRVFFIGGPAIGGAGKTFFSPGSWGRSHSKVRFSGTKTGS